MNLYFSKRIKDREHSLKFLRTKVFKQVNSMPITIKTIYRRRFIVTIISMSILLIGIYYSFL